MACDTPLSIHPKGWIKPVDVPCGKCPPCKRRRVNSWVFRLNQQDKISTASHFITLTYDTRYIPISSNGFMTLQKRDLQLYWKRLRKSIKTSFPDRDIKIKFFAVGEYGSKRSRPHYHAIVFNVPDVELFSKAWQLGSVHVGRVSGASLAYTCKYIDKPSRIPMHSRDDRVPEYSTVSNGIGKNYLTDAIKKYHKADITRNWVRSDYGTKIALPRYYRDKIYDDLEKKAQVRHILKVNSIKENLAYMEYLNDYGFFDEGFTFDRYMESQKYGRYFHFYKNQKQRL
jgi:hypothetical protein